MLNSAEEWVEKAKDQYSRERFDESILSANKAIEFDEDNVDGWWYSALSFQALGELNKALDLLDTVTEKAPYFANGWARYGAIIQLLALDGDDYHMSSKEAFEEAISWDDKHVSALTALAKIHFENDSDDLDEIDKEIHVLTQLDEAQGWLTSNQLNRLGIFHYKNKKFFDAIKFWGREVNNNPGKVRLFNLGLAYNHNEVSQDADAIDIWRMLLERFPDYSSPQKSIEKLLPRLLVLSKDAMLRSESLLSSEQWYQNYINPFELINYPKDLIRVEELDVKKIQKLRKRLLVEIDLEDGHVSWMGSFCIDRSKAIDICEGLHGTKTLNFHIHVFNNKSLLGFLSRGEHKHFTVDPTYSPVETIEYFHDDKNGFATWITEPFVEQFSLVLCKAIETRNLSVLEALLDGRRWINSSQHDACFIKARLKITALLKPVLAIDKEMEVRNVSLDEIRSQLEKNSLLDMLNLFPTYFHDQQNVAVDAILNAAISNYKHHGDIGKAKKIIELTRLFSFKSEKSNGRIQRNIKDVEDILEQEKQYEAFLTIGGNSCSIRVDGIHYGTSFIPTEDVESVRFGLLIDENKKYNFLFVFKGASGLIIHFKWSTSSNLKENEKWNIDFAQATFHYIFPAILERMLNQIKSNGSIRIGGCELTADGIEFEVKGLIFSKKHFVSWSDVDLDIKNGAMVIMDIYDRKKRTSLSLREVDNVYLLRKLHNYFN